MNQSRISGCLLGTAVGDALGLPYEGLSPARARRLPGPPDCYRFLFGFGMVSDDTEHTCLTALAVLESQFREDAFAESLSRRLRYWLLLLPSGAGLATARSVLKLWLGFPPGRSGVFSAGNGPAMRAAILGVTVGDPDQLIQFVKVSSRITHSDPRATYGALAVAVAAAMSRDGEASGSLYARKLAGFPGADRQELLDHIQKVVSSVQAGQSTPEYARESGWGRGVSGYIYHSVPIAIHAWLSHPTDFRKAVQAAIACGGDADTTAAIVGGIVGAAVGKEGIPAEWIKHLSEWPRSVKWMERLGMALANPVGDTASATAQQTQHRDAMWPALLVRNLFFFFIVLFHGFRRLFPPY